MDSEPTPGAPFSVIPAVDVLGGRVVRLRQGDYEQVTEYGYDPVEVAQRWVDDGAGMVHVVDLEGARSGQVDQELWRRLGEAGLPFQAGGGMRTADAARSVLGWGAARVVMGTAAVWDPVALAAVGRDVVAALDVRGGKATGSGWRDPGRDLGDVLAGIESAGVARILVTGIARDGTLDGPDLDLTGRVLAETRLGVIASGGVARLSDLDKLVELGCEAIVVGRALYEGRFTLSEARRRVEGGR